MNCKTCKHWTPDRFGYHGSCGQMQHSVLIDFEIDGGWSGGVLAKIETDPEFGCVLYHKRKEVDKEES